MDKVQWRFYKKVFKWLKREFGELYFVKLDEIKDIKSRFFINFRTSKLLVNSVSLVSTRENKNTTFIAYCQYKYMYIGLTNLIDGETSPGSLWNLSTRFVSVVNSVVGNNPDKSSSCIWISVLFRVFSVVVIQLKLSGFFHSGFKSNQSIKTCQCRERIKATDVHLLSSDSDNTARIISVCSFVARIPIT